MSNLPITNSVSMNPNYLPQGLEKPAADKPRDPLLSKAFTHAVVDNGALLKGDNVMVNRDALARLFDMFESAVRAIRTLLSHQGILPKSTPDAGALKTILPDTHPDSALNSDKSLKPLPKADPKLKTTPEADPKAKLLSNIASKMLPEAGAQPHVPAEGMLKSKSPAEPAPGKSPKTAAMLPMVPKADAKLLSEIAAKAMPDAPLNTLLSGKTKSTLPADVMPKDAKSDVKSLADITAKALLEAGKQVKVTPEATLQSRVTLGKDLKASPEAATLTKTLHRDVPGVKLDTAQETRQTADINVNVQVINCGFHHPEANIISHRWDATHVDGQPSFTLNTPDKPKVDGQPTLKLNTPDKPKVDGQPTLKLSTPDKPKVDGQPTLKLNTPDKPKIDAQPPVVTPGTDTKLSGPLPAFTPEPRPKLDLTAPGPADDHSAGILNSRNRTRFDAVRASNSGRQPRA